ncbi:MAG TPA: hypothetical protein VFB32_14475 [Rudaea sp.]|nr:hypothetical protein [Rudaea sp.]
MKTLLSFALLALTAPAAAQEPTHDLAAFKHWVDDNLNCRRDFAEDVQTRSFLDAAKALGVKFETDWQEGDTPEGKFVLPSPVLVGGQPATEINYWADSGGEFYATVSAPPDAIAKALGANPVPEKLKNEFAGNVVAAKFIRAKPKGERIPPAIFVRQSEKPGITEVGCVFFDG